MSQVEHMREMNLKLDAILADPEAWFEYAYALMEVKNTAGPDALTREQALLVSACQFDTCIQSSGLFSYFELQPYWAQFGSDAMKMLGLHKLERVMGQAEILMGLTPSATEDEIRTATQKHLGTQLATLLDQLEPLEDAYYDEEGSIPAAFMAFVRANQESLKQANR